MILVAPTERQIHELLSGREEKWQISSLPERHGCDLLIPTKSGIVGFQRKTLPDLLASLHDGRLYYELNQITSSATVSSAFLIVESTFEKVESYFYEANISISSFRSIIAKFSLFGVGFLPTDSPDDTITACLSVSNYLASGRGYSIHRPKQVTNEWGRADSKAYSVFLLQSFPGIGPKVAEAIYDHFSYAPIAWTVNAAELAQVPGIGRKRAESLIASLAASPAHSRPVAAAGS